MSEQQMDLFAGVPDPKPDPRTAIYLEARRLLAREMQVSEVLDSMLLASFGSTISGLEILDIVMRASRRGRGRRVT